MSNIYAGYENVQPIQLKETQLHLYAMKLPKIPELKTDGISFIHYAFLPYILPMGQPGTLAIVLAGPLIEKKIGGWIYPMYALLTWAAYSL